MGDFFYADEPLYVLPVRVRFPLRHITVVLSPWERNIFGRAGMMCSP